MRKPRLRTIIVDGIEYRWFVRYEDPSHVTLRVWREKKLMLEQRVAFDDPWINYGPILTATDRSVFQLVPVQPSAVAQRIRDREFDVQYSQWLDRQDSWPAEWRAETGMTNQWLLLTPDQLGALAGEVQDLLARYRRIEQPDDGRARRISVWQFAFPVPGESAPEVAR